MWRERRYLEDDTPAHTIRTVLSYNYHTACLLRDLLYNDIDVQIPLDDRREKVLNSDSSRFQLYCILNPKFHVIYTKEKKKRIVYPGPKYD